MPISKQELKEKEKGLLTKFQGLRTQLGAAAVEKMQRVNLYFLKETKGKMVDYLQNESIPTDERAARIDTVVDIIENARWDLLPPIPDHQAGTTVAPGTTPPPTVRKPEPKPVTPPPPVVPPVVVNGSEEDDTAGQGDEGEDLDEAELLRRLAEIKARKAAEAAKRAAASSGLTREQVEAIIDQRFEVEREERAQFKREVVAILKHVFKGALQAIEDGTDPLVPDDDDDEREVRDMEGGQR